MASREQGRRGDRRETVHQDDQLAARLVEDQGRLLLDDLVTDGPFTRFAATSDRLAELDRERAERFLARDAEPVTVRRVAGPTSVAASFAPPQGQPGVSVTDLTRLTERLVDAREQLATAKAQLESQQTLVELAATETRAARAQVSMLEDRLMAARALVHEAQRVARQASERTAFVEGRADALDHALDQALHASFWQRRRLRRERYSVSG